MQRSLPLPKYHSVYLVLKERLTDGVYDAKVPGEMDLMAEFGVSRATVRKALENLATEGIIERTAGRGTRRVAPAAQASKDAAPAGRSSRLAGLLDNLVTANRDTTIRVVEHETVEAAERVAKALAIEPRGRVLRVVRVRGTAAGPVSCITTWVPREVGRGLTRTRLGRQSILQLIEAAGVELGKARQIVSARQADATVAELLKVPLGSALLSVDRVVYDADNRPIMWLQGLYRPDRYEYEMELSRVGQIDARVWVGNALSPGIS